MRGHMSRHRRILRSTYGCQPPKVARAIRTFAGFPTVTVEDGAVLAAVRGFVEKGMDFAYAC